MADQKTPVGLSLNRWARKVVADNIAVTGRNLPCVVTKVRGQIVTVAFQVTAVAGQTAPTLPSATIPVIGAEYVRMPIQAGCKGFAVAADAYLGGMSGLGGGTATLAVQSNLSAIAFAPLGNTGLFLVDSNTLVMYGPGGVKLMDQNQTTTISLVPGNITLSAGGHSIVISSSGVVIDGRAFLTHQHTGVQTGTGDTAGVL